MCCYGYGVPSATSAPRTNKCLRMILTEVNSSSAGPVRCSYCFIWCVASGTVMRSVHDLSLLSTQHIQENTWERRTSVFCFGIPTEELVPHRSPRRSLCLCHVVLLCICCHRSLTQACGLCAGCGRHWLWQHTHTHKHPESPWRRLFSLLLTYCII